MNQPPLFLAIRAVSAEFARRIYVPVVIIVGSAMAALTGLCIWLVTLSGWWWFLFAPIILVSLVGIVAATVCGFIITVLRPAQTRAQNKDIRHFVSALHEAAETVQTPRFILLFRLTKDVLIPSKKNLITEFTDNITALQPQFKKIIDSFKA